MIDKEELKKLQLDILDRLVSFCEENDIKYFLASGTMLGAVRHKGYIPWDDDVDVGMLRSDYEKFSRLFPSEGERYIFKCIENDPGFCYPFGKVLDTDTVLYEGADNNIKISVYVDVFPYDTAPEDRFNELYNKRDRYRKCRAITLYNAGYHKGIKGLATKLSKIVLKMFPQNSWDLKIIKNAKKYSTPDDEYVGNFCSKSRIKCRKIAVTSFVDMDFENKKYKIPAGYDEWLSAFYGKDYMTPLPEDKREPHLFKAYYKNEISE